MLSITLSAFSIALAINRFGIAEVIREAQDCIINDDQAANNKRALKSDAAHAAIKNDCKVADVMSSDEGEVKIDDIENVGNCQIISNEKRSNDKKNQNDDRDILADDCYFTCNENEKQSQGFDNDDDEAIRKKNALSQGSSNEIKVKSWHLWKPLFVQLIGFLNVVIGIFVSIYFIITLTLSLSPIFLIFVPFILFRAATPDILLHIWKKVKLRHAERNEDKQEYDEDGGDFHANSHALNPLELHSREETEENLASLNENSDEDGGDFYANSHALKPVELRLSEETEDNLTFLIENNDENVDCRTTDMENGKSNTNNKKTRRVKTSGQAQNKFDNTKRERKIVSGAIWRTISLCFALFFTSAILTLEEALKELRSIQEDTFLTPAGDGRISLLDGYSMAPRIVLFAKWYNIARVNAKKKGLSTKELNNLVWNSCNGRNLSTNNSTQVQDETESQFPISICTEGGIDEEKWKDHVKRIYHNRKFTEVSFHLI